MANTTIKLKKSGVTGNIPSLGSLEIGELAINYIDGKLYYNTGVSVGSIYTASSFSTINSNNSLVLATSPTDILSLVPGSGIEISTNTSTKSITISATFAEDSYARDRANDAYDQANSSNDLAQSAFNKANSSNTLAQAAYDFANTISASSGLASISDDNSTNNVVYVNFTDTTSGNLTSIKTSSANLTFVPSTGTLNVNRMTITPRVSVFSNNIVVSSETVIDSLSALQYRSVFYQIQLEQNGLRFHSLNLTVLHNGVTANTVVFGEVYDNFPLATFSAEIVDGLLNVKLNPIGPDTYVTFVRNAITQYGSAIPSGDFGYVTESVTDTLNYGFDADPVNSTYDYGSVGS